jgi:probable nitrogen fixation protein
VETETATPKPEDLPPETAPEAATALVSAFVTTLVRLVRAEDTYGSWEKRPDADLLKEFIVDREARRTIPIVGDPGPDVLHRVEQFYKAVALRIEQRTGLMASPMMKMSHEGFGRLILTTGRLVAYAKSLRDIHRFGFDTFEALAREGEKAVDAAAQAIETYPAVARA